MKEFSLLQHIKKNKTCQIEKNFSGSTSSNRGQCKKSVRNICRKLNLSRSTVYDKKKEENGKIEVVNDRWIIRDFVWDPTQTVENTAKIFPLVLGKQRLKAAFKNRMHSGQW